MKIPLIMRLNVRVYLIVITAFILHRANGKIFERCELARLLKNNYRLPIDQVANWVCIAQYQSGLNSSLQGGTLDSGSHGLFQISDEYWCSPPGKGWVCEVTCDKLRDDDLSDDLACIQLIYEEHQRISGDGYNAWSTYQSFCKGKANDLIQDCFRDDGSSVKRILEIDGGSVTAQKSKGKIFDRCELAKLFRYNHGLSLDEVAHWVCLAQHQSGLNSSAVNGPLDSKSYGIFQISSVYWCSSSTRRRGGGCALTCDQLTDSDLTDDLACAKIIYNEHQRISNDGYTAWSTYQPYCRGKAFNVIEGCFDKSEFEKSTIPAKKPFELGKRMKTKPSGTVVNSLQKHKGKIYSPCELAQELHYKHEIPMNQIGTWVCIAQHESSFNTSAVGRLNADGSEDHGLFQISDIYWCSPPGKGWVCGISCSQLEDSDITDDVKCMRTIYEEHERISGDGFNAWSVYQPYCKGRSDSYIDGCFKEIEENLITDEHFASSAVSVVTEKFVTVPKKKKSTGKVYTACELAKELKEKHHVPEYQIATWVCIAKYESNFNTSAIGYGDHGLFQISDIYWCSPPGSGKACRLSCSDLEDDDISDDVQCIRKIFEEHTRLSGDGFKAWTVYPRFCSGDRAKKYIKDCKIGIYDDSGEAAFPVNTEATIFKEPQNAISRLSYRQPSVAWHYPKVSFSNTRTTKRPSTFSFRQSSFGKFQSFPSWTTTRKPSVNKFQSYTFPTQSSLTTFRKPWWEQQTTRAPESRNRNFRTVFRNPSWNSRFINSPTKSFSRTSSNRFGRLSGQSSITSIRTTDAPVREQFQFAPIKSFQTKTTNFFTTKSPFTNRLPLTTTIKPFTTIPPSSFTTVNFPTTTKSPAHQNVFDHYFNLYKIPSPFSKTIDGGNFPEHQGLPTRKTSTFPPTKSWQKTAVSSPQRGFSTTVNQGGFSFSPITTTEKPFYPWFHTTTKAPSKNSIFNQSPRIQRESGHSIATSPSHKQIGIPSETDDVIQQ